MKKLTNIREVGRYKNPETGRFVNIKRGRVVGRASEVLFFLRQGHRIFIDDSDFYHKWKPNSK